MLIFIFEREMIGWMSGNLQESLLLSFSGGELPVASEADLLDLTLLVFRGNLRVDAQDSDSFVGEEVAKGLATVKFNGEELSESEVFDFKEGNSSSFVPIFVKVDFFTVTSLENTSKSS